MQAERMQEKVMGMIGKASWRVEKAVSAICWLVFNFLKQA